MTAATGKKVKVLWQEPRRGKTAVSSGMEENGTETGGGKIRVGAYCRVSTDHEDQETSFEAQKTHFESLIKGNKDWELVGIYADEESGTRASNREGFLRMIADCEAGKIDMVLTKSISRWARNTLDSLQYIRKLKSMQIPIYFTKEGINTMDAGGEVLITIMASIAQQESASISQNVQIGVRYHYQEGKVCSGVHMLLGYERTPEGSLSIVPGEAIIVRRIFRDYLDGYGARHLAEVLAKEGVETAKKMPSGRVVPRTWNYHGIEYILRNEKYTGDLLLQKYYTVDFLTKKVAKNAGHLPQYYVENSHEPIVPKDIFQLVQTEVLRRHRNWRQFSYTHSRPVSRKLVCGLCGSPLRCCGGIWRCDTRLNPKRHPGTVCTAKNLSDAELQAALLEAFRSLPGRRKELGHMEGQKKRELHRAEGRLKALEKEMQGKEASERAATETGEQWAAVTVEWAECALQLMHIRNLRDRIDAMEEVSDDGGGRREAGPCCTDTGEACAEADRFYRITRPAYPRGPVAECADDDIIRFVERVTADEKEVCVIFKAGIRSVHRRKD